MVSLRKITQDATRNTYLWVPQQDFTESADLDWKKDTADLEQALYNKYELTDEECSYIEYMVKVQA